MKRGLVIGRFLPPHAGHLFLCRTAAAMTDELCVLVCTRDADSIPGALRFGWMQRLLPFAHVAHLDRRSPDGPEDDPDLRATLRAALRERAPGPITHVFASKPDVFRFAEALGAEPVLVDPDRETFRISGREILAGPAKCWRFLPDVVRPHFQKRLTLLGPESVGKTRLAADLGARFETLVMPEYGRAYDVHYKQGEGWAPADFVRLAETHAAMRRAMQGEAGPLLIEDTDAVQTAVWSQHLVGGVAPALADLEKSTPADHYLLLAPDVGWIADGVRYAGAPETRTFFFEELRRRIAVLGASYDIIRGDDWTRRTDMAIAAVRRRFPDIFSDGERAPADSVDR